MILLLGRSQRGSRLLLFVCEGTWIGTLVHVRISYHIFLRQAFSPAFKRCGGLFFDNWFNNVCPKALGLGPPLGCWEHFCLKRLRADTTLQYSRKLVLILHLEINIVSPHVISSICRISVRIKNVFIFHTCGEPRFLENWFVFYTYEGVVPDLSWREI